MNPTDRLSAVQSTLQNSGVVDVKFYFARGSTQSLPLDEFADKAANFLEAYSSGKGKPLDLAAENI